ncbi:MAG TPA: hypothetical protein OIM03_01010 [Veillonellaceae bacterium]|nr:hypothetical protein [Veillonellaceae bacterium]
MKKGKQTKLSTKILLGLLAAGMTFGMTGTAQAADPTAIGDIEDKVITDNWFGTYDGKDDSVTVGNVKNNSLTNENTEVAGGGIYLQGHYDETANTVVAMQAAFNESNISGNTLTGTEGRASGGAVALKGVNAVFNDAVITGNKATGSTFAHGGAIFADYKGNYLKEKVYYTIPSSAVFNVTKDAAFTGNDIEVTSGDYTSWDEYGADYVAPSGGGFLALAGNTSAAFNISDGATLTIGKETPATSNEDTIASALVVNGRTDVTEPSITKKGDGTLTINSNLNRYYGTFTQEAGTVNLNQELNLANKYELKGGTLNLKDVVIDDLYDKLSAEGFESTKSEDEETLTITSVDYLGSYERTIEDSVGILDTASGTIVNAEDVIVKDGGKIQTALGALNFDSLTVSGKDSEVIASGETTIKGDFSASDGASVIANDLSVSGAITVSDGADVTIGGSWLVVGQTTVDETSKLHLSVDAGLVKDAVVQADGLLDVSGNLTADGATINAQNATIGDGDGGTVTAENGSTVTLGGDDLTLSAIHVVDADSQVILQSGTLGVDALSTDITGEGKVTITEDAVLQTKAAQVFTNTETTEFSAQGNDFSDAAKAKINFEGGTLALEDNYTPAYLSDVKSTLEKSAENTTLFMSGTLMAEGTGQNRISANDAGNLGENITLDQVTATSSSDVVIGADEGEIDGFSVGTLALSGDAKSVTVSDGKTLTLGGTTTSDVITATAGTPTINLTNDGTLNIGNDFVENNHELNVGADIHAEDSTIYTNGTTTITGAVSLADSGLSSEIGSLTLEKALTTSGETGIAGTVTAEKGITSTEEGTIVNVGTEDKTAEVTSLADIDVGETGTVVVNEGSILNVGDANSTTMTVTGNLAADGGNINTYGTASVSGTTTLGDGLV